MLLVFILTIPYTTIKAQSYDSNQKSWFTKYLPSGIGIIVLLSVLAFVLNSKKETNYSFNKNQLTISGAYGGTYQLKSLELIASIPEIKFKNQGYSLGETRKGNFKLDKWNNCLLFTESGNGPFILGTPVTGRRIIFNKSSEFQIFTFFLSAL